METQIFYFSGTGNTLFAAKNVAGGIKDSSLIPITQVIDNEHIITSDCKRVGFIFPLYYLSFPEIVMRFIENLEIPANIYVFTVVTRGFPPMGGAIKHLDKILKKKGNRLHLGLYLDMPSNDLILFGTFKDKKKEQMLEKAAKTIPVIVSKINNYEQILSKEPFAFLRRFRHTSFLKRLKQTDAHYWVKDNCNGCSLCQKICPVGNITIKDNKPIWSCTQICQECEGCINYCPLKSIEYGKKSKKWERYHHPNIKVKDLMEQSKTLYKSEEL